jgi:hypothetical protein
MRAARLIGFRQPLELVTLPDPSPASRKVLTRAISLLKASAIWPRLTARRLRVGAVITDFAS